MAQYFIMDSRGFPRRVKEEERWRTWLLRAAKDPNLQQLLQIGRAQIGHLFVKTSFLGVCEDDDERNPAHWVSFVLSIDPCRPYGLRKQTAGGRSQAEALHSEMLGHAQTYHDNSV